MTPAERADTVRPGRALSGPVVGYAPGVFDMFHVGHLNLLRRARLGCGRLVAGVVSDDAALQVKGRWPVVPEDERLAIISAMTFVDVAVLEWSPDKLTIWEALRFDVLFKGDDWRGTPRGDALEQTMAGVGVRVIYLPYTAHTSTTGLRAVTSGPGRRREP